MEAPVLGGRGEHRVEALPGHTFHDVVNLALLGHADVVHRHDVGVLKLAGDAGLGDEPLQGLGI